MPRIPNPVDTGSRPLPDGPDAQVVVREVTIGRRVLELASFRNISAVYIFVGLFVVFSLWIPDTFLSSGVWRTMLDAQAITALAALAVVIPMVAGSFNLAVGAEVGFAGILVANLLAGRGLPVGLAVALTLMSGAMVGLITGLLIIRARIDSLIATLGTSSVLLAGMAWISGGQQILNLGDGFRSLTANRILSVPLPVFFVVGTAAVAWYVLERTPVGRRMYATGFNANAARLAGIDTDRIKVASLVAGGIVSALAGVLMSSRISAGDPTVGPSLLLPAFTAAFLGSTQFRGGRFNVWGTILAVYVLATGVKGLQLTGAPSWITELFNGVALLLAVGLSKYERTSRRASGIRRALRGAKSLDR